MKRIYCNLSYQQGALAVKVQMLCLERLSRRAVRNVYRWDHFQTIIYSNTVQTLQTYWHSYDTQNQEIYSYNINKYKT